MKSVLTIDPGGTTGWCWWWEGKMRGHGYFESWKECAAWVLQHRREWDNLVVEKFEITARTLKLARSYDAMYLIGALQHICTLPDSPVFHFQTPADAKSFATDAKLARLQWKIGNDHTRDAARHMVLFLFRNGMIDAKELVSGDS